VFPFFWLETQAQLDYSRDCFLARVFPCLSRECENCFVVT
jgi:hypothetical protein